MGTKAERRGCVKHVDSSVRELSEADAPVEVHLAVAHYSDIDSLARFDTARGEKQQRNVLSVTLWPSLLLTAHYSCHIVH